MRPSPAVPQLNSTDFPSLMRDRRATPAKRVLLAERVPRIVSAWPIVLAISMAGLALLTGCRPGDASADSSDPARAGSEVTSPQEAQPVQPPRARRIISLAPSITEIIYTLDGQDDLVGVTQYCKFPPEAQSKPKVGALVNLSYERVLSLQPDLAIHVPAHREAARGLARLDIATVEVRSETIEDLYEAIRVIGEILGKSEKAKVLVGGMREDLAEIRRANLTRAASGPPPRVLFIGGRNPGTLQQIYVCGSGTFMNEIIEAIGAKNAIGRTSMPWPVVNKEKILQLDPDMILDGSMYIDSATMEPEFHMRAWEQLGSLAAVREDKIIALADDRLTVPGPGMIESARRLSRIIFGSEAAPGAPQ